MNHLALKSEKLDLHAIKELVTSPDCGAISLFLGTTRDNMLGKTVVKLEYEAYESMALKEMQKVCDKMREMWPQIKHIAIIHRLGEVPVMEESIIIAVSSPHRKESLDACDFCINEVKKMVPVWKKVNLILFILNQEAFIFYLPVF